jgi:hypothetical protein
MQQTELGFTDEKAQPKVVNKKITRIFHDFKPL